jgi:hypothetical protein
MSVSRNSNAFPRGGFPPFADYLLNDCDIFTVEDTGKIEQALKRTVFFWDGIESLPDR